MFRIFYTLLITLISPLALYALLKKRSDKPAVGSRWKEYFGHVSPLKSIASTEDDNRTVVWLHTVSVGEVLGATAFVRALKKRYPEVSVVMTTTTTTGAEQVGKLGDLVEHRFMPLDFPWAIRRFIRTIQPNQLLIMETELWPNTLAVAKQMKVPVSVINARLSQRSAQRYQKLAAIGRFLARHIEHIYCLHQDDAKRFESLGFAATQVSVTGSLKFDIQVSEQVIEQGRKLRAALGVDRPVWIAASTHQGEDEQLLEVHRQVITQLPNALMILVPRHPERFKSVAELVVSQGMTCVRRTYAQAVEAQTQVYLADTMGEMMTVMSASDVCFMAGSLLGDKVGGHNLLEPAALGLPTITGPSYFNFTDITQQLLQAKATTVCETPEQIATTLVGLLNNESERKAQGQSALQVVNRNRGSIDKTLTGLFSHEAA